MAALTDEFAALKDETFKALDRYGPVDAFYKGHLGRLARRTPDTDDARRHILDSVEDWFRARHLPFRTVWRRRFRND